MGRIGALVDGGFVATWRDDEKKDGLYQIHSQVFGADREPRFGNQTVNQIPKGTQINPAIGT